MTSSSSNMVLTTSSSTTAAPAATSATGSGSSGNSSGPTSSPLLFFVALGFGVVFTNLWIIVGVKYCFRYNQRNRRLQQDENGEPIDMTAMPQTRRRRREKKLMTMDEVNERFPLLRYKAWMTSRAEEGLPTAGGVAVPSGSRPVSVRDLDATLPNSPKSGGDDDDEHPRPDTSAAKTSMDEPKEQTLQTQVGTLPQEFYNAPPALPSSFIPTDATAPAAAEHAAATTPPIADPIVPVTSQQSTDHAEDLEDEDDQIQRAVPTEMLANPGDSCAICIDTLEDDDDVRGLTCGHAFHASCLDPWLTSRRACCPLCKADYYIPKPRPEGEAAPVITGTVLDRYAARHAHMPQTRPNAAGPRLGGRPRFTLPTRAFNFRRSEPSGARQSEPRERHRPSPIPTTTAPVIESSPEIQAPAPTHWRSRLTPTMWRHRRPEAEPAPGETATTQAVSENETVSPSALESGQQIR